jgi:SAM-dependent methyltransferase
MMEHKLTCRFCSQPLHHSFVDLGMSPLCQTHISADQLERMEPYYPLHAYVCRSCYLVQLPQYVAPPEIFSEYAYFSSFADSWVQHARAYCELACERFGIGRDSLVMEVASNDGYLLQHFVAKGIRVLGIEPAANVAAAARARDVPTVGRFLGAQVARELVAEFGRADLLIANNVLAHVPDLNDFVAGLALLLRPGGLLTLEFPHLLELIRHNQFDTIYHEHFSYFSCHTVTRVLERHGLAICDVERLTTHGGSLRVYARHAGESGAGLSARARELLDLEQREGLEELAIYAGFEARVHETKRALLEFLIAAKRRGKKVVGYGAPGKGNTLLNYCGIGRDFLDFTVDRNPYKQGKYTPGMRIPIRHPDALLEARPDYILILPWNLKEEILASVGRTPGLSARFVVPIPRVEVLDPAP